MQIDDNDDITIKMNFNHEEKLEKDSIGVYLDILNDKSLSLEAIGLFVRLLAKPKGWKICPKQICREMKIKRSKLNALFDELIFCEKEYIIGEEPEKHEPNKYNPRVYSINEAHRFEPETPFWNPYSNFNFEPETPFWSPYSNLNDE